MVRSRQLCVESLEERILLSRMAGFAFDQNPPLSLDPGDVLVVDRDTPGVPDEPNALRGAVFLVDPVSGEQQLLVQDGPFLGPQDATFSDEGLFYVVDRSAFGTGAVFVVDLHTGFRHTLTTGGFFENPRSILWDSEHERLLVVDTAANPNNHPNAAGAIIAVDPVTGEQELLLASNQTIEPVGLIAEPEGTYLLIDQRSPASGPDDPGNGRIFRLDPVAGTMTVLAEDGWLVRPREGAIGPDGALYVADWAADPNNPGQPTDETGSIIRIDRVTGEQSLVAGGGNFIEPWNLAFTGDGDLLVADKGENLPGTERGVIHQVDLLSGAQEVVVSGGEFAQPTSIVIIPEDFPDVVVSVEPLTGGETAAMLISGGPPHGTAHVFFSAEGAVGTPASEEFALDLDNPVLLKAVPLNEDGSATVFADVPSGSFGTAVEIQVVTVSPDGVVTQSSVIERVVN